MSRAWAGAALLLLMRAVLLATADSAPYLVTFPDTVLDVLPLGVSNRNGRLRELIRDAPEGSLVLGRYFSRLVHGFSGNLTTAGVIYFTAAGGDVELDQGVTKQATVQSWGLDRIEGSGSVSSSGPYEYTKANTGAGVHLFVVDTGINSDHNAFRNRIGDGIDYVDEDDDPEDCDGHGTHCAGTAAGQSHGVAAQATVHAVRVLNCDGEGSFSDLVSALEWIADHPSSPKVASLSLGGPRSVGVNRAVDSLVDSGTTVVVAAGNNGGDASDYSPASAAKAITVGATTIEDRAAPYTNAGSSVDILAPGSAITSAWVGSATATATISGTSMAAPHVAGLAVMAASRLGANPSAIASDIQGNSVTGRISDTNDPDAAPGRNVPNRLAQVDTSEPTGPPPSPTPSAPPSPPSQPPAPGGAPLSIRIRPDLFPSDISWKVFDMDGDAPALVDEGRLRAWATPLVDYEWTVTLPPSTTRARFTILDAQGDGICCAYGDGEYAVSLFGAEVAAGAQFADTESTDFDVSGPARPPSPPSQPPGGTDGLAPPPPPAPGGLKPFPGTDRAGTIAIIAAASALGLCAACAGGWLLWRSRTGLGQSGAAAKSAGGAKGYRVTRPIAPYAAPPRPPGAQQPHADVAVWNLDAPARRQH